MSGLAGHRADSTDEADTAQLVEMLSEGERVLDETIGAAFAEPDVDRAISDVLERLGTHVGARRVILCEMIGRNKVTCTYEWSACGAEPLAGRLEDFNFKPYSDAWRDAFNEQGMAAATAGEGLDLGGAERIVTVPVCVEGRRVGYGAVIDAPVGAQAGYAGLMRHMIAFVGVLLRKRNDANDKDRWNRRDPATGAQNRASLYAQARHLDKSEPLGLVSCDINGLRAINRMRGFEAGDAAIAWLANAMLKCFRSEDVFRLGDDEFLAWLPVVNELAFSKRVEKLCAKLLRGQVEVAFAQKWYPSWENKDIDQLIDEMDDLRLQGKHES